ncbi:MAG: helix-turn-helix transcriptional regulator, partial [Bacillota bacterium]|nr:helix-turn-helix transcriptional regulator [Bacillota bacterium]
TMKEINIAKTITEKRREKGITQEDLAAYMGVSKASVSKWETGQSYPDIAFLPQLAAYFNISIDQLMDYSPQMAKEDIRKLYQRLATDFGEKPFREVLDECHQIIKKYHACFPLLLQMSILLLNHCSLAPSEEQRDALMEEIIDICIRIKSEGKEPDLSAQANSLHAMCCLIQQRPAETIDLLDGFHQSHKEEDSATLSSAYLAMGNVDKAKEILQISIYTGIIGALSSASSLLLLNSDDREKSQAIIQRANSLIETFDLKKLHIHTTLIFYLSAAKSSVMTGETEDALDYLERYTQLACLLEYPVRLHGDEFFDHIEEWFKTFDLGSNSPTEEATIRANILHGVTDDPAFSALKENPRCEAIIKQLTDNLEPTKTGNSKDTAHNKNKEAK